MTCLGKLGASGGVRGALVALAACACAPVYVAPAANAPLFGEAGEGTVGAALGTQGVDVHGGYAPIDHFAALAAVSYEGKGGGDSIDHHHFYGEGALGGFWTFGKAGRIEAFAGLGYGSSGGETVAGLGDGTIETSASGKYLRPFVQIDLGGAVEHFEGGFVLRVLQVHYHYDEIDGAPADVDRVQGFWEPLAVVRAGAKSFKVQLQGGVILPVDALGGDRSFDFVEWVPFHLSIGVHARFGGSSDDDDAPAKK